MPSPLLTVLNAKYRMVNNTLETAKKHIIIHIVAALGVLFVLIGGGTAFFYVLFDFLMHQEVFGPPLMDRLMGMVFLAFFAMLIFSNLIITLTTTYISREVEYLMSLPMNFKSVFWIKLIESIFYSSWAFAILSLPIFLAFGTARQVNFSFYLFSLTLVIPFLTIPAGLGAMITMVLAAYFPARKTRTLCIVLAVLSIAIILAIMKLMGMQRLLVSPTFSDFSQIMAILSVGASPVLPNYWLTRGVISASAGEYGECIYWLLMLLSTAGMVLLICYWLIPRLYYKGWCLSRERASTARVSIRTSAFNYIDRLMRVFPQTWRALIGKDIKVFWRDPTQWTQLIILFGLLFIYVANLRNATVQTGHIDILIPKWQMIISFFNMGATCFILSILTTRFVYPMLSLEGRQYWVIGLAPMKREKLVWEKYWLSWLTAFILTEGLMIFSNIILKVSFFIMVLSLGTVFILSIGLTSLAVGLGAMTPNFKEDNPARIANGLGGTLNVVFSLIYIGLVIIMEVFPIYLFAIGKLKLTPQVKVLLIPYVAIFILINLIAITLPMYIGLKRWQAMEF